MPGQGSIIRATDYNAIQSNISTVLGTGSGYFGYGQTLLSSPVAQEDLITQAQWDNLRLDLLRARQHQTGLDESSNLIDPTTTTIITEAAREQFANFSQVAVNNKFSCASNQGTIDALESKTRTTSWNNYLKHTIVATFSSANHMRHFFNAGGSFRFTASRTGGSTSTINQTYTTILDEMGTVIMNHADTTSTGTTPIVNPGNGYYGLTPSVTQRIYRKRVNSSNYYGYYSYGQVALTNYRIDATLSADSTQIIFEIYFESDSASANQTVDGTLTSTVQLFRPSGTNVSIVKPASSQSGL